MPSVSKAQRTAMAIAEHNPSELYARNRGLLKMSKGQLHDFAATKEKGLPARVKSAAKPRRHARTDGGQYDGPPAPPGFGSVKRAPRVPNNPKTLAGRRAASHAKAYRDNDADDY